MEWGHLSWLVAAHLRMPLREVETWTVAEVYRELQVIHLRLIETGE